MTAADPASRDLVFLDVETNGVDPTVHDAWEFAWWNLTTGARGSGHIHIPDVAAFLAAVIRSHTPGDPLAALRVNRFIERYTFPARAETFRRLDEMMDGVWADGPFAPIIVGSKPTFDMAFMSKVLAAYPEISDYSGTQPWHHHPIDLGSYAVGVVGGDPTNPPSARRVAELVGVDPGDHTAEGDVTSGGRAFLLLRAAAAAANYGDSVTSAVEWLHDRTHHGPHGADIEREFIRPPHVEPDQPILPVAPVQAAAEAFDCGVMSTVPCGFASCHRHYPTTTKDTAWTPGS